MPLLVLVSSTFTKIPGRLALSNFTLRYWVSPSIPEDKTFPHGLLRGAALWSAAWNSIRIMGVAALLCGLLGLVVGYVVTRSKSRFVGRAVRQLSFLPYLVPGVSLAAAYILLFSTRRGPIPPLYGTLTLLLVAMVVLHLPYSSRSAIAAFAQTGRSPEEAARIQGASFRRTATRIVFPMQLRSFVTGVTLAFVSGLKELNVVIMLTLTSAGLLTTLAVDLDGDGYVQLANGVTLFIVVVALGGYLLLARISRIDLTSSFGGTNATGQHH
jgi:iron(III) transport system permease protein